MQKLRDNRGSVLVGVVAFTAILAIVVLSTIGLVRNMQNNEDAAFCEAQLSGAVESGVALGAALVNKQNSYATTNTNLFASSPVTVNGIAITVRSAPSGTDTALITAVGTMPNGAYTKTVQVRIVKGSGGATSDIFTTHGIYGGANVTVSGNAYVSAYDLLARKLRTIYGGTEIRQNGRTSYIAGNLASQGSIIASNVGTKTPNMPTPTSFPNIDLTELKESATLTVNSVSAIPAYYSGTIYLDADNVTIANKIIVGTLIVRGSVDIRNSTIGKLGKFGVISETGNISSSGTAAIWGTVYAKAGNATFTGTSAITGNIFAKNDVSFSGTQAFTYWPFSASVLSGITLVGNGGTPSFAPNSWNEVNN